MIGAIDPARVLSGWCLLFLIATLYDRLVVDRIERLHPSIGVTAWEVVGGVTFTLVVFGMVAGWQHMMLALLLFSGSGIPMILGSSSRHAAMAR